MAGGGDGPTWCSPFGGDRGARRSVRQKLASAGSPTLRSLEAVGQLAAVLLCEPTTRVALCTGGGGVRAMCERLGLWSEVGPGRKRWAVSSSSSGTLGRGAGEAWVSNIALMSFSFSWSVPAANSSKAVRGSTPATKASHQPRRPPTFLALRTRSSQGEEHLSPRPWQRMHDPRVPRRLSGLQSLSSPACSLLAHLRLAVTRVERESAWRAVSTASCC